MLKFFDENLDFITTNFHSYRVFRTLLAGSATAVEALAMRGRLSAVHAHIYNYSDKARGRCK
eukprot:9319546-Pyramimonas_sp.AAC.1